MTTAPPPLPPQPLQYRGDPGPSFAAGAQRRTPSIFSLARFVVAVGVVAILAIILLLVIPRFEVIYKDFGVKLPMVTVIILDTSRFLRTPIGWAFGILIAGVVGVVFAVLPIKGRWLRLLVVTVLALLVIARALALFMPMISLIDSISGSGKA